MANSFQPSLQEVLRGYQDFNRWQEQEELLSLPRLSFEESLGQYFELCDLVRPWHPKPALDLSETAGERAFWIELVNRHRAQSKG